MSDVVKGPELVAPSISLLTSADTVSISGERWYSGFRYQSDGCGEKGTALFPVCGEGGITKSYCDDDGIAEFFPYTAFGSSTCSTIGSKIEEHVARARRRLIAGESYWLEAVLWGGANVPAFVTALGNPVLQAATSTVVTAGGTDHTRALAALEDALADKITGRAMIHMRPGMVTRLATEGSIRREGNVWLTATDNIVVPGRGYAGTGPAGQAVAATEWMYASGMVQVRRGPIMTIPGDDEPRYFGVHMSTNDIQVLAERVIHAALPPCAIFAAEVNR